MLLYDCETVWYDCETVLYDCETVWYDPITGGRQLACHVIVTTCT